MNRKELIILVADKNMEHALKGVLSRPEALRIRAINPDIRVHPRRDPGCEKDGVEFLRNFSKKYCYALLLFDHKGSGKEQDEPNNLEEDLFDRFKRSSWGGRAKAIVLSPELEAWVWSNSPHVDKVIGWKNRQLSLRDWLTKQGYLQPGEAKPNEPKKAFEAALRETKKQRSSSLYEEIAKKVSLDQCEDRAFQRFKDILYEWFSQ